MFLSSVRQALAALFVAVLVTACGGSGDPAPAPTGGIAVSPGDGKATVTWQMDPNVKYWVFYAPTTSAITTANWTNFPGSVAAMNVSSPYVVTGLVNGFTYGFTVNGRTGDAAGGPGSPRFPSSPVPPVQPGRPLRYWVATHCAALPTASARRIHWATTWQPVTTAAPSRAGMG